MTKTFKSSSPSQVALKAQIAKEFNKPEVAKRFYTHAMAAAMYKATRKGSK